MEKSTPIENLPRQTPRRRTFATAAAGAIIALALLGWWVASGTFAQQVAGLTGSKGAVVMQPSSVPACGAAWRQVVSPNPSKDYSELHAISAANANDIWAVGTKGTEEFALTLTMHWDGSAWKVVDSPVVANYSNHLHGVAAVASNDVWAVGASHRGTDFWRTLVLHWDGTGWSIVPTPTVDPITSLNAIAAVAANDVWAVGEQSSGRKGAGSQPFALHWDGTRWSNIPIDPATGNGMLNGITAFSQSDVWAVGSYTEGADGRLMAFVMHWDGAKWSRVPTLAPGELYSVAGVSASDMWAVGNSGPAVLTMHKLGADWQVVDAPNPGHNTNNLDAVTVLGANDVWAVGGMSHTDGDATLAMHWDGTKWTAQPGLLFGTNAAALAGAANVGGQVWAAGSYIVGTMGVNLTVVERYNDPCAQ